MRAALGETAPWRVVLAFDRLLAEPLAFRNAAVHLAGQAEALTRLGAVEIVVIDEEVRASLPPTRDATVLAEALGWLRLREVVEDPRGELRDALAAELAAAAPERRAALARQALADEATLVRASLDAVLRWAAAADRQAANLLVVATGDLGAPSALLDLAGAPAEVPGNWPSATEAGAALSALGWTVLPFTPTEPTDALLAEGEPVTPAPSAEAAAEELDEQATEVIGGTDPGGGEGVLFDPDRLREALRRRRQAGEPAVPGADPALASLAGAAAGRVLLEAAALAPILAELASWRPALWSQPAGLRRLHGGLPEAVGARWVGSGSPAALAAARARGGFGEAPEEGEFEVGALARHEGDGARIEIEAAADGLGEEAPTVWRLTVAIEQPDGSIAVEQHELAPAADGALRGSLPLAVAPGEDPPIVVLVDSPETPAWGVTFAGWLGGVAGAASPAPDALLRPAARSLRLLAPGQPLLVGVVTFHTVIADPAVARIEFFLDGERRAVSRALPFTADLDLGPLPRVQRVEAAAFDAAGRELARDALLVNGGSGSFLVTLTTPDHERTAGGVVLARGRLPVDVEILAPAERPVARVEFYWGERLVATRTAAPFRETIPIPSEAPEGFVRAVATLVDGAAAEDVVFVNTPGAAESVEVTLVQLYVVVTGEDGRPVQGLGREDFRVAEEGEPRQLASFSDAADLPLTVGLAVDASASMFVKLADVRPAAADFLHQVVRERDRAFVVGFGGEPRLARGLTGDLERLAAGIASLRPAGQTAIWKAIVYSLVQLQGVPGMKALVVYSDGADEDPDFAYRTARRFAQLVGIPIYVILTNNEIVRTEGHGLQVRGFIGRLEELVEEVGGRVVFTRVGEDLREVYGEIARELRSQYVLGYYADRTATGEWREVEVVATRAGLTARGPSGYWH